MRLRILFVAFAMIAFVGQTRVAIAEPVTDANIAEAIANAKTMEDHEAIAAYFRTQAAEQAAKVKLHEAMLKSWEKTVSGKSLEHMRQHCNAVIAGYRKMQQDYEAMAKMHDDMGHMKH